MLAETSQHHTHENGHAWGVCPIPQDSSSWPVIQPHDITHYLVKRRYHELTKIGIASSLQSVAHWPLVRSLFIDGLFRDIPFTNSHCLILSSEQFLERFVFDARVVSFHSLRNCILRIGCSSINWRSFNPRITPMHQFRWFEPTQVLEGLEGRHPIVLVSCRFHVHLWRVMVTLLSTPAARKDHSGKPAHYFFIADTVDYYKTKGLWRSVDAAKGPRNNIRSQTVAYRVNENKYSDVENIHYWIELRLSTHNRSFLTLARFKNGGIPVRKKSNCNNR